MSIKNTYHLKIFATLDLYSLNDKGIVNWKSYGSLYFQYLTTNTNTKLNIQIILFHLQLFASLYFFSPSISSIWKAPLPTNTCKSKRNIMSFHECTSLIPVWKSLLTSMAIGTNSFQQKRQGSNNYPHAEANTLSILFS